MSNYTPGPWEYINENTGSPWADISIIRHYEEYREILIAIVYDKAGSLDNARLIAAAPELKDSLKEIVDALERCMYSPFCVHPKLTNRAKALLRRIEVEEDSE